MPTRAISKADEVMVHVIAWEFAADLSEVEAKIKRRLRYHHAGPYRRARAAMLFDLWQKVSHEVSKYDRSAYYVGPHGRYAAFEDYDTSRMVSAFGRAFPRVSAAVREWLILYAVFLCYVK